jgi:hypothetical protein
MFTAAVALAHPAQQRVVCYLEGPAPQPHSAADSGATTSNPKNELMTHRPDRQIVPSFEDPKLQFKISSTDVTDAAEIAADRFKTSNCHFIPYRSTFGLLIAAISLICFGNVHLFCLPKRPARRRQLVRN